MKKYVKPEIRYENFALSESIATACESGGGSWVVRGAQSISNCYASNEFVPEATVYLDQTSSCSVKESEAYCNTYLNDGAVSISSF